jgi:hypothetical protein
MGICIDVRGILTRPSKRDGEAIPLLHGSFLGEPLNLDARRTGLRM